MKRRLFALLLAAAASPAAAQAPQRQGLAAVHVLSRGEPAPARRVNRVNAFYRQDMLTEGGIAFDIPLAALEALRDRFGLEDTAPFILMEWVALGEGDGGGMRHLGYLHCSSHATLGRGFVDTCFRDGDDDGRIEGVVVFQRQQFPAGGLQFQPIDPIPYHYVQNPRTPVPWSMYVTPGLGIAWNLNRENGRLLFYAQVVASSFRADVDPPVEVDPAQLPATIEIAGAQLTVLSWDGHRPTVRIDRPLTDRPFLAVPPDDPDQRIMIGARRGWSVRIVDAALPHAAE